MSPWHEILSERDFFLFVCFFLASLHVEVLHMNLNITALCGATNVQLSLRDGGRVRCAALGMLAEGNGAGSVREVGCPNFNRTPKN